MRVAAITSSGDWKLGKGRAQYVSRAAAVRQNVVTRIRSFQNDWYADVRHGIDWIALLGNRANQDPVLREVERIVLGTPGVGVIERLRLTGVDGNRRATIDLRFNTLFDEAFDEQIEISP